MNKETREKEIVKMKETKEEKKEITAEDIIKQFDGEVVADGTEPLDLPEQVIFDTEIVNKNITIYGVKELGERAGKFGKIIDYELEVTTEGSDRRYKVRSNHTFVLTVVKLLHTYHRPIKCRVFKATNGKYYLSGWQ